MTDLKLLDELLIDFMRARNLHPRDLESPGGDSLTREIVERLRQAYASGEMPTITLTWANYFKRQPQRPD